MKVIGITGPTGAGKTTALNALRALGAAVIDADAVYHELLGRDGGLKDALCAAFGRQILNAAGEVDRKELARAVYPGRMEELNRITHPVIVAEILRRVDAARSAGYSAAAIDAAALIESGLGEHCDTVVAVLAPLETRVGRVMAREGVSEAYARRRAAAQPPDSFYRENSGYVLENTAEEPPAAFARRAEELFQTLLG